MTTVTPHHLGNDPFSRLPSELPSAGIRAGPAATIGVYVTRICETGRWQKGEEGRGEKGGGDRGPAQATD